MNRRSSGVVTLAALLVAAVLLLRPVDPLPSAQAQDGNVVAALAGQVAELQFRVYQLEEKERLKEENLVVKGTLTVLDPSGKQMLMVFSDGDSAKLQLGQGGQEITLASGSEGTLEIGTPGGPTASLAVNGEHVQLLLGDEGGINARLLQKGNGAELIVGEQEGKQSRLTQDADGGELIIGDPSARHARLVTRGDFTELLLGQDSGKQVHILENGEGGTFSMGSGTSSDIKIAGKGDGGVITIGKEGGNTISLTQKGGDGKITIGPSGAAAVTLAAVGKGGELFFGTEDSKRVNLATNNDGGKLELGKSDGTRVQIGTTAPDRAIVQVAVGDRRAALESTSELVGMISQSEVGAAQVGDSDKGFGMVLSKQDSLLALIGQEDGDDPAVQLYGTGGNEPTVVLQGLGQGGRLLIGKGGEEAAINLKTNGSNDSQLLMGLKGSPHIEVVAAPDQTSLLVIQGKNQAGAFSDGSELKVFSEDNGNKAELGKMQKGWGLMLTMGQQLEAALSTLEGKGMALRMYEQGQQVGAFGAAPDGSGGTLRIYAGGPKATVSLGAVDGAGVITAYDSGGNPILALDASQYAIAVYSTGGAAIAQLSKSSTGDGGNVTTSSGAGSGVFSAGAASDGGGEACVIRQNGKGYCLGIGLPGMGSGN